MNSQLELFTLEDRGRRINPVDEKSDYVILLQEITDLPSDQAEEKGLIKVVEILQDVTADKVEMKVDMLNYKMPVGSTSFYSWTILWGLHYLMPATYDLIMGDKYEVH